MKKKTVLVGLVVLILSSLGCGGNFTVSNTSDDVFTFTEYGQVYALGGCGYGGDCDITAGTCARVSNCDDPPDGSLVIRNQTDNYAKSIGKLINCTTELGYLGDWFYTNLDDGEVIGGANAGWANWAFNAVNGNVTGSVFADGYVYTADGGSTWDRITDENYVCSMWNGNPPPVGCRGLSGGFWDFNISEVPTDVYISDVKLIIWLKDYWGGYAAFRPMDEKSTSYGIDRDLWLDVNNGSVYADGYFKTDDTWFTVDLGVQADIDLEAKRNGGIDWFSVGLRDGNGFNNGTVWTSVEAANKPSLRITYVKKPLNEECLFDLGSPTIVERFKFTSENYDEIIPRNAENYTIYLSNDKEDWVEVVSGDIPPLNFTLGTTYETNITYDTPVPTQYQYALINFTGSHSTVDRNFLMTASELTFYTPQILTWINKSGGMCTIGDVDENVVDVGAACASNSWLMRNATGTVNACVSRDGDFLAHRPVRFNQ